MHLQQHMFCKVFSRSLKICGLHLQTVLQLPEILASLPRLLPLLFLGELRTTAWHGHSRDNKLDVTTSHII